MLNIPPTEKHPGKFETSGALGEALHEIIMDGFADDDAIDGDASYSLLTFPDGARTVDEKGQTTEEFRGAIVYESSDGFVDVTTYATAGEAQAEFDRISSEIAADDATGGWSRID